MEIKILNNRFVEDFVVNWKNNGFLEDFVEIWKSWRWNSNFLNSNCFGVRSCNERGYICLSEIVISGSFTSSGICMLLYVFRVCSLWKRFLGLWFVCFCLCVFVCLSLYCCSLCQRRESFFIWIWISKQELRMIWSCNSLEPGGPGSSRITGMFFIVFLVF